jgi:anti-sigma factor RsiW
MTCQEFQLHRAAYVDGELGVDETLAAEAHVRECPRCRGLAEQERRFRLLLRRQPRESAPPEFRARLLARGRQAARRRRRRAWLIAVTPMVAAAALLLAVLLPGFRVSPSFIPDLVAAHIAYAEIERPVEFASDDRGQVAAWFQDRAGLRVVVPDYTPAGIRLVGGRIAEVRGRRAAYVLYKKGHALLSVFVVPASGAKDRLEGRPATYYRGHAYVTQERKGYRVVAWADGPAIFGLVSGLDYEALLECADRLRQAWAGEA